MGDKWEVGGRCENLGGNKVGNKGSIRLWIPVKMNDVREKTY